MPRSVSSLGLPLDLRVDLLLVDGQVPLRHPSGHQLLDDVDGSAVTLVRGDLLDVLAGAVGVLELSVAQTTDVNMACLLVQALGLKASRGGSSVRMGQCWEPSAPDHGSRPAVRGERG